eukprot:TRINITY_DN792_c0_g1_i1.p1 TRINITY_DN792_c0_g1~~TRINITY_DN792_c0_g1_i1.p1  ORF type:complete len:125 (+),score=17.81 TRINITY_DN792_c0_g1_i1:587-961(+)
MYRLASVNASTMFRTCRVHRISSSVLSSSTPIIVQRCYATAVQSQQSDVDPPVRKWCVNCGKAGHKKYQCTAPKTDGCFICGDKSHKSKDCTKPRKCNHCGASDHIFANCPNRPSVWGRKVYEQ